MSVSNQLKNARQFLLDQKLDGWLLYDFRGSNPIFGQFFPGKHFLTRRVLLFIPATGEPELLAHSIDASQFAGAPMRVTQYLSWQELHKWIEQRCRGKKIAMEYSPKCALPAMSFADGGAIDLVRSLGGEVLSSADVVQACVARWSDAAIKNHALAAQRVTQTKDEAFDLIRKSLSRGEEITEYQVQQHIVRKFDELGLKYPDPPIVAVNAHSGDPHFELSKESSSIIRKNDWVLIDLWARIPGDENIYSDITWVGCAGSPTAKQREVYQVVKNARDACTKRAVEAWKNHEKIQGWQLDDAARDVIIRAGYEKNIRHRTGHSLSGGEKVHGLGMNVDNLETHDTREMIAGIGFTIEPGIYLPEFGVRLEINIFVDPSRGPVVTSCVQDEIVRLG